MTQDEYIQSIIKPPNPYLDTLLKEESLRKDVCPSIGPHIGNLVSFLVELLKATRVVEFGTCLGYSTICLAQSLEKTRGKLISIESSPRLVEETKKNVYKAGLAHRVTIIEGKAEEVFDTLPGPFDLILQDASKEIYLPLLNKCVKKLRPGGLLLSDDVLFPAKEVRKRQRELINEYNQALIKHPELTTIILPLGDGIAISMKKY
ncbi:MAG: O-methyltransferase [Zhaonellaceae bacterium]|jgi:predicted O-methyltransferase YrrM